MNNQNEAGTFVPGNATEHPRITKATWQAPAVEVLQIHGLTAAGDCEGSDGISGADS